MSLQVLLGLSGVIIVAFSVLGSMGLCSFFGVKSTLIIVEVIPFLVLAVRELYYFCSLAIHAYMHNHLSVIKYWMRDAAYSCDC